MTNASLDRFAMRSLIMMFARFDKWGGRERKNGELLALVIGAGFEVLLTIDQNLRYQQNLSGLPIALVVMVAPNNKISELMPLIP